jgi:hypothetical protein
MREFAGKAAFVTGGASGIGLALGRAFAEEGCKVMLADIEGSAGRGDCEPLRFRPGNTGRRLRCCRSNVRRRRCRSNLLGLRQSPYPMQQCRGWCSGHHARRLALGFGCKRDGGGQRRACLLTADARAWRGSSHHQHRLYGRNIEFGPGLCSPIPQVNTPSSAYLRVSQYR